MRIWRQFIRHRPAMVGLAVIVVFLVLAAIAPLISHYDPTQQNLASILQPPSRAHLLGTDELGRDIATRIIYGTRISLLVAILAVGLGVLVGVPLGMISGYFGGWIDLVLQRLADMMLSFSVIVLALTLVSVLGIGVQNVVLAVGASLVPVFMRLVRSSVLSLREQQFVEAANALGGSDVLILRRHILRNVLTPVIVTATLGMGITILAAAGLGFLGLGVRPPTPEWGSMLGEGRQYIFSHPNLTTFPGIAIMLAVLAFNLMGDGLRDALDPHRQTERL